MRGSLARTCDWTPSLASNSLRCLASSSSCRSRNESTPEGTSFAFADRTAHNAIASAFRNRSRRATSQEGGSNKVSALFTKLGTDEADPIKRLRVLSESNRNAKEHHKAISADTLQEWAEFAAPRTFGLAVRVYSGLRLAEKHPVVHNLVISNVPGPPVPLYFMGAKIDALYPLGPVFHGAGLNITVMSNNGSVHVGINACRELMPRVWDLARRFPDELATLKKAVEQDKKPAKKTAKKSAAKKKS